MIIKGEIEIHIQNYQSKYSIDFDNFLSIHRNSFNILRLEKKEVISNNTYDNKNSCYLLLCDFELELILFKELINLIEVFISLIDDMGSYITIKLFNNKLIKFTPGDTLKGGYIDRVFEDLFQNLIILMAISDDPTKILPGIEKFLLESI